VVASLFHAIYSSTIKGVAILAGGIPYGGIETLHHLYDNGDIDSPDDMSEARVFIAYGSQDFLVTPAIAQGSVNLYSEKLGLVDGDALKVVEFDGSHVYPSSTFGPEGCTDFQNMWSVNKCGYEATTDLLQHLYPDIDPSVQIPMTNTVDENKQKLVEFSQEEFCQRTENTCADIYMAEKGYYYAPPACATGGCKVHVAIHGCALTAAMPWVDTNYISRLGAIEFADAHNIIVIFPQTAYEAPEDKPNFGGSFGGCWNHGNEFSSYLPASSAFTYNNPQMAAIYGMVQRATSSL
jgi:hypothetical protein